MQSHYEKYGRKSYHKNKHKYVETRKRWTQNNREKVVGIVQAYVSRNKQKVAAYNRDFGLSAVGKYRLLKYRHAKRGWTDPLLSLDNFSQLFTAECFYCGSATNGGLDRVDNSRGYCNDNVVPCCKPCNYMKRDLTQADFLSHINKISTYGRSH